MDRISHTTHTPHSTLRRETPPPDNREHNSSLPGGCINDTPQNALPEEIPAAHEKMDMLHDAMDTVHVGTEMAGSFENIGETAASLGKMAGPLEIIGGAGALVSGIYFGITGPGELKKAIETKDVARGIEAGGHMLLAGEAAIETAQIATHSSVLSSIIGPAAAGIINSPIMKFAGTALGVAHGAAETVVGLKEMYDGYKIKDRSHFITGLLDLAMGASMAAIALGAGPIVGLGLAAAFGIQMARLHLHRKAPPEAARKP